MMRRFTITVAVLSLSIAGAARSATAPSDALDAGIADEVAACRAVSGRFHAGGACHDGARRRTGGPSRARPERQSVMGYSADAAIGHP